MKSNDKYKTCAKELQFNEVFENCERNNSTISMCLDVDEIVGCRYNSSADKIFFLFALATLNCLGEGFLVQELHILELIERVLRFMRWCNSLPFVVDLQDVLVVA